MHTFDKYSNQLNNLYYYYIIQSQIINSNSFECNAFKCNAIYHIF